MRRPFILLLAVTGLVLCAVPCFQSFKATRQKQVIATLQTQLDHVSLQLQQLRSANERLRDERREWRRRMSEPRAQSAAAESEPTTEDPTRTPEMSAERQTPASEGRGPALRGFLSKMMEDPEMQDFVRNQHRQMLDPLYQPLIQRLGLTKGDADAFKDFLADTQLQGAQHATALFNAFASDRAEAMEAMTAEQNGNEQAIREFLGEEGYAQYKDYQETLGERAQLNQYRMQNAGSQHALTDEQIEWLLSLMQEEKRTAVGQTGQPLPANISDPANLQATLSGEAMESFLQRQAAINQRVYERAAYGLSREQLEAFGGFQTNQLEMMRLGMIMARDMFAPDTAENGSE